MEAIFTHIIYLLSKSQAKKYNSYIAKKFYYILIMANTVLVKF
jgi:hypothetical protein